METVDLRRGGGEILTKHKKKELQEKPLDR